MGRIRFNPICKHLSLQTLATLKTRNRTLSVILFHPLNNRFTSTSREKSSKWNIAIKHSSLICNISCSASNLYNGRNIEAKPDKNLYCLAVYGHANLCNISCYNVGRCFSHRPTQSHLNEKQWCWFVPDDGRNCHTGFSVVVFLLYKPMEDKTSLRPNSQHAQEEYCTKMERFHTRQTQTTASLRKKRTACQFSECNSWSVGRGLSSSKRTERLPISLFTWTRSTAKMWGSKWLL